MLNQFVTYSNVQRKIGIRNLENNLLKVLLNTSDSKKWAI